MVQMPDCVAAITGLYQRGCEIHVIRSRAGFHCNCSREKLDCFAMPASSQADHAQAGEDSRIVRIIMLRFQEQLAALVQVLRQVIAFAHCDGGQTQVPFRKDGRRLTPGHETILWSVAAFLWEPADAVICKRGMPTVLGRADGHVAVYAIFRRNWM